MYNEKGANQIGFYANVYQYRHKDLTMSVAENFIFFSLYFYFSNTNNGESDDNNKKNWKISIENI